MSLYFKCLYIILLFLITTNAPAQERLIPIGAMGSLNVAEQLPYEAVNAGYVLAAMKKTAKNQLNIVILDACRNNPFKSKGFGGIASNGLVAPTTTPNGFLIAYATAAGHMAIDGNERNLNQLFE